MSRNSHKDLAGFDCCYNWVLADNRLPEPKKWYLVYGCRLKPSEPRRKPEFEEYSIHLAFLAQKNWYDIFTAPVYVRYWMKMPNIPAGMVGRPIEDIHEIIDPLAHVFEKTTGN